MRGESFFSFLSFYSSVDQFDQWCVSLMIVEESLSSGICMISMFVISILPTNRNVLPVLVLKFVTLQISDYLSIMFS